MELLQRIINSKKFIYTMIPLIANVLMAVIGKDVTQPAMLAVDGFFGLLVAMQGVHDAVHGSPSDKTDAVSAVKLRDKEYT